MSIIKTFVIEGWEEVRGTFEVKACNREQAMLIADELINGESISDLPKFTPLDYEAAINTAREKEL